MQSLYERYASMTDDERFQELMAAQDMTVTNVNRLDRTLRKQLAEQDLEDAVLGRSPYRDPAMPAIRETPEDAPQAEAADGQ